MEELLSAEKEKVHTVLRTNMQKLVDFFLQFADFFLLSFFCDIALKTHRNKLRAINSMIFSSTDQHTNAISYASLKKILVLKYLRPFFC